MNLFSRCISTHGTSSMERERMDYDVIIVGGGCAGLSTAIRLKDEAAKRDLVISVCVLEKGEQIGSHVLSGCLIKTQGLSELIPDWKDRDSPIKQQVKDDSMRFLLGQENSINIPRWLIPRNFTHHDSYIVSLGSVCRWLSEIAEDKGIDIFTSTGVERLMIENETVTGVYTTDRGVTKDQQLKEEFQLGYEIRGKTTVLAEGVLGNITEEAIARFNLQGKGQRTYGLGMKEIWEISGCDEMVGKVVHTTGYPLQRTFSDSLYGGGFVYCQSPQQIHIGYIVGLDYSNPLLSPYNEFQQFKQTDFISSLLRRGERIEYGARTIYEGGILGQVKPVFPGGLIVGESLGMMNMGTIQGTDQSIQSGIMAADTIVNAWTKIQPGMMMTEFVTKLAKSKVNKELHNSRSFRAMFEKGLFCGMTYAFISGTLLFNHNLLTHFIHPLSDAEKTNKITTIDRNSHDFDRGYIKPDGIVSFDRESSLSLSCIDYPQDEISHISINKEGIENPEQLSWREYEGVEERFCPAHVYEFIKREDGKVDLQINSENCLHCKTCMVKTPKQYLKWTVPSSGGPNYSSM